MPPPWGYWRKRRSHGVRPREGRKASYSNASGGNCVETAIVGPLVAVRDSTDPDGARLAFTAGAWDTFLEQVKRGGLTRSE